MHHILRSDGDDELHDHPWDNRTLMVTYGYWEITRDGRRWIAPGDIVIRKAHEFHRIELEPGTHPLTIFWHGPKINDWGFLGRSEGRRVGKECGSTCRFGGTSDK